MSLERFHQAQMGKLEDYATALAEIRKGRKLGHWIWYVLPQIAGLGRSSTAQQFALRDLDEACANLRDPVLRSRCEEIVIAVAEQLARGISVDDLMGGSTDALKLASSATLFRAAASQLARRELDPGFSGLAHLCDDLLRQTVIHLRGFNAFGAHFSFAQMSPIPSCNFNSRPTPHTEVPPGGAPFLRLPP